MHKKTKILPYTSDQEYYVQGGWHEIRFYVMYERQPQLPGELNRHSLKARPISELVYNVCKVAEMISAPRTAYCVELLFKFSAN